MSESNVKLLLKACLTSACSLSSSFFLLKRSQIVMLKEEKKVLNLSSFIQHRPLLFILIQNTGASLCHPNDIFSSQIIFLNMSNFVSGPNRSDTALIKWAVTLYSSYINSLNVFVFLDLTSVFEILNRSKLITHFKSTLHHPSLAQLSLGASFIKECREQVLNLFISLKYTMCVSPQKISIFYQICGHLLYAHQ